MIFRSRRSFKAWQYTVSHNMLLLRSPKDDVNVKNVDLVFFGVVRIELDTDVLEGIVVSEKSQVGDNTLYEVISGESVGQILAAGLKEYENDRDLFDTGIGE